jgi:two-component system nitrate/nitrite response regulator NarL
MSEDRSTTVGGREAFRMPAVRPADPSRRVRVLVVDDHPMVRQLIVAQCESRPELHVVGEAGTGREAVVKSTALHPDVVVMDVGLPDIDGYEAVRRLRAEGSSARVLVLTGQDGPDVLLAAVRERVDGFLEKTSSIDGVAEAVVAVASGKRVFTAEHLRNVQAELALLANRAREVGAASSALTRRERDVLNLLAQGLSTRQMAERLRLSDRTVAAHLSKLYQKLNVRTRVQALREAAARGLVSLHD